MTHTVLALRPGAAFSDIVKALQQWQVSAAPVLDEDGRVAGVVSEANLLRKEEAHGDARNRRREPARVKAAALTAEELMTAPAVTVRLEATLPEAARTMARHGVKRLPVVDADGLLKGVVSRADLLKVFLRDAEEIRREIVPHLFADSAEPVGVHGFVGGNDERSQANGCEVTLGRQVSRCSLRTVLGPRRWCPR
ncbi:CBS domain-containing protein [Streptomyces sp. NPDC002088]|uniref:CBS domain-containing protein n=1 Tax=Streptomyces sp. NPDC002088 TaxID=3154665 RepID=UPI0033185AD1